MKLLSGPVPLLFFLLTTLLPAAIPRGSLPADKAGIDPPSSWAPLVFKPGAATERSYREDEIKWFEKHLIPAISKSWEGQPWKDQALTCIRERLWVFQWRHSWESPPPLKIDPKQLADAGCRDPWVRLLTTHLRDGSGRRKELREAFQAIRDAGQDPALLRFAALPVLINKAVEGEEWAALVEQFTVWTAEMGTFSCYAGKDGDWLFRHIYNLPGFSPPWADLLPRLKAANTMPAWVIDTIAGEAEASLAWNSRGSGWGNSVTEEGWKGFHRHLGNARKHLEAAWRARPDQPHAAAIMIAVVMGDGAKRGENERLWFDRATAACFDYNNAYVRYRQALLPRWGGSYGTMLAFGLACVDSGRFDTFAPISYFETLNQMGAELKDFGLVYRHPEVIPRVLSLNDALLAAATTPEARADRQSFIALDGWLGGDWASAHKAMATLKDKPTGAIKAKMEITGVSEFRLFTEITLFGGKNGALARQAEARTRAGDHPAAVTLWKKWLENPDDHPAAKRSVGIRLRAAELAVEYGSGKWINIPINNADDWELRAGRWNRVQREGLIDKLAAVGKAPDSFHCAIYPLCPGPRFELRATFELTGFRQDAFPFLELHTGVRQTTNYRACSAVAGLDAEGFSGFLAADFSVKPNGKSVRILGQAPDKVVFYFRRDAKGLTFALNNQTVLEQSDAAAGYPDWEQGHIAVGAQGLHQGQTLTITSVEVHRLP